MIRFNIFIIGLIAKTIKVPNKNAVKDKDIIIFKLETPKVFKVKISFLLFKETKYHIEEKNTIKGISLIIVLGTKSNVKKTGKLILTSKFLKNSISSNKFKTIPSTINTKIKFTIILR